jgi:mannose-6-phosphate isomerase-like protein (cupin superfamily)
MNREQIARSWADHVAPSSPFSQADMEARVARWGDIPASSKAYVDTVIPGHERTLYSVVGSGVTDDPKFKPKVAVAENFHVDYIVAPEGAGAALHWHDSEEVFIAQAGRWAIDWLDGSSGTLRTLTLEPRDLISVPPFVHRAFRSLDGERGLLISILGGKTPSRVKWDASVATEAKARGVGFDADGMAARADE